MGFQKLAFLWENFIYYHMGKFIENISSKKIYIYILVSYYVKINLW